MLLFLSSRDVVEGFENISRIIYMCKRKTVKEKG
jgi:hypothetical protein